jgi:hypothetical protein
VLEKLCTPACSVLAMEVTESMGASLKFAASYHFGSSSRPVHLLDI